MSAARLLVDLGNSRLKWALAPASAWQSATAVHAGRDLGAVLDEVWGRSRPPQALLAVSVAPAAIREALERWVSARWGIEVRYARARAEQCGVINRYREPEALGADRWAAVIGARVAFPGRHVAVVDCGTAVTVDALSAEGEFLGGVIAPGIGLQRQALVAGTGGIRVTDGEAASCLARTTGDAVAAGTLHAVVGLIERACADFERALGAPFERVLTGGDAGRVAAHLGPGVHRAPDLVLQGLSAMAGEDAA
jgi:type III pantothenate kinase